MHRYHWKLLPWPSLALCAALLALLPCVVSFRYLGFQEVATIGECFAPLVGTLLFTPLAFCEGHVGRREALGARPVPYARGFGARLALMLAMTALASTAFVGIAAARAHRFAWFPMGAGLLVTMLLYGGLGLTTGHLLHNQAAAYLLPLAVFALEFFTRGQYTGRFFTLSLMRGAFQPEKWMLGAGALALLGGNVALCARQLRLA